MDKMADIAMQITKHVMRSTTERSDLEQAVFNGINSVMLTLFVQAVITVHRV